MKAPILLEHTPMLMEKYYPGAMQFPVWVERKYNGVRCVVVVGNPMHGQSRDPIAYSREGRVLEAGLEAARDMARLVGSGYFDGELVGASFRATLAAVKRKDPSTLRFKVWDMLYPGEAMVSGRTSRQLHARRLGLLPLMPAPWVDSWRRCVDLVPGGFANSEEQLQEMYKLAMKRGWEGLVIKDPRAGYRCGERTRLWMKMKPKEGDL